MGRLRSSAPTRRCRRGAAAPSLVPPAATAQHGNVSEGRRWRKDTPTSAADAAVERGEQSLQGMPGDIDERAADALIYRNYATKVQARYDQHRAMYQMLMTTADDAHVPHT